MRARVRVYENAPFEGGPASTLRVYVCRSRPWHSPILVKEWKMLGVPPRRLSRHLSPHLTPPHPSGWATLLMSRTREESAGSRGVAAREGKNLSERGGVVIRRATLFAPVIFPRGKETARKPPRINGDLADLDL